MTLTPAFPHLKFFSKRADFQNLRQFFIFHRHQRMSVEVSEKENQYYFERKRKKKKNLYMAFRPKCLQFENQKCDQTCSLLFLFNETNSLRVVLLFDTSKQEVFCFSLPLSLCSLYHLPLSLYLTIAKTILKRDQKKIKNASKVIRS